MIRAETPSSWILISHPDHAGLAGDFGNAWGNEFFAPPEPLSDVLYAVRHHDDGWLARDSTPSLTPQGKPEAFTSALVGAYSAFEEIDLPSYLDVRGRATASVAEVNRFAGILVSMHTVNLLTEQADINSIRPEHRQAHADFVAAQQAWQRNTATEIGADWAALDRGYEFLQCCDNVSLIGCAGYNAPRDLRHAHPDRSGQRHTLHCEPIAPGFYRISPWPFRGPKLILTVPFRQVAKAACSDLMSFRAAFAAAPLHQREITLLA